MDKKHRTDGRGQRTAKPGEIYAFYVDMLGRYGACQILEADGEGICYVLLDYLGQRRRRQTCWKGWGCTIRSPSVTITQS